MTLTLNILRCPDAVAPQTRTVTGGEFSIGRGSENDWVLPDPERFLSKRHCLLAYRSGGWQVADISTNGTFLNGETEPIGHGQPRDLHDGDRLRFGAYEIELRIVESAMPQRASVSRSNPFALDPFASPARPSSGLLDQDPLLRSGPDHDLVAQGLLPPSINVPPDYDPLAPEPAEPPFAGPTQPDHSPHLEDAFRPAVVRSLLPDDWDHEPAPQSQPAIPPAPVGTEPNLIEQVSEPLPSSSQAAPPPAPGFSTHAAPTDDLLAAFLRGTGLSEARPADPAAAMEALGAAFRALVSGLRLALIARSAIKGEFRIEQTVIRSRGNNPLKFSADDDDALLALLGAGRHVEMGAAEAISDGLRDMRLHEIATVAAMRSTVRALFARFDPIKLNLSAEQSGMNLLPMQKKARAWESFVALYAQTNQALADDFDSVFGKAFASAYERALGEALSKDKEL
jgi:type VI secretion system protein ImpI/type VI secretion system protein